MSMRSASVRFKIRSGSVRVGPGEDLSTWCAKIVGEVMLMVGGGGGGLILCCSGTSSSDEDSNNNVQWQEMEILWEIIYQRFVGYY